MLLNILAENVRWTGRYLIDHADELVATSAQATMLKMRIQIKDTAFHNPVTIEVLPVYERKTEAPSDADAGQK